MQYGKSNLLDKGLMGGDPSMQLGMQLLANSNTPGNFAGILGRSMLGTQEAQQKNAQSQLGLLQQGISAQQAVQMWPYLQQAMGQAFGQPGQQQQDPNAPPPTGGAPGAPMGAPGGAPGIGAPVGGGPQSMANLGAIMAMMGRPGGGQLIDNAKFQAENDPTQVTRLAAAKGEIAVDQAAMANAFKSGNMPAAQAAYTKFLKDAGMLNVSAMSGDVTTFGGITPQSLGMSNFNPARGTQTVGGVQTPIPGAPGTQQALAGAEAQGRAQGELVERTDPTGAITGQKGATYFVPKSTLLGGGGGGSPSLAPTVSPTAGRQPSPQASPQVPVAKMGPGESKMIEGNASTAIETNKAYQQQVEAGQQMLANTAELRHAAADFGSGRFSENRATMLDLLNSTGLITAKEKNELGSAQVGQKIAIQLQAAATKQLGSREAAQIFSIMGKSLPNLTLSGDGLEKVSAYLDGMARYNIARGQLAQQRSAANDANGVNNVRGEFVQNTNPLYYIVASASKPQQAEMIKSMGTRGNAFLQAWNDAARAGWAPKPGEYNAGP